MPEPHEEFAAAQAALYGQYVAKRAIYVEGARAFNEGDAVPASHVDSGIVSKDDVDRVATKTAATAAAKES